ncbi:thymidylate synthase [Rathayibacter soli]|uniref:thymidylate synthase n=1 Tax=Rathayibacter soli TaxID=3144168 RepID=UPI0027E5748C|nr:thymidylate synthase [Glaciibacter superstes]
MTARTRGILIDEESLGEAWLAAAARILEHGRETHYDALPIRELEQVTIEVAEPDPNDAIIAELADPERLAWMHANFTDHSLVSELGDAASYASRLHDYGRTGRDQVAWVIDRLRSDAASRSATISTFEPLTDTSYVPCVSMLDFWLPDGSLELIAYCHSIDFGTKGYGNLVELAALQCEVARAVDAPVGRLTMIVKSAHVYATEYDSMRSTQAELYTALGARPRD